MGVLSLTVQYGSRDLRLELRDGAKLVLGRASSCDLVLESKAVSAQHLEILWDGRKLSIRDLGSTHGTKTLPEEASFEKRVFPPSPTDLQLLLADTSVRISWSLLGEGNRADERTAVAEAGTQVIERTALVASQASGEMSRPLGLDRAAQSTSSTSSPEGNSIHSPTVEEKSLVQPALAASGVCPLIVGLVLSGGILYFLSQASMARIFEADPRLLGIGGALDYYVLLIQWFQHNFWLIPIFLYVSWWGLFRWNFSSWESRWGAWKHVFALRWTRPVALLLVLSALFFPLIRVKLYGVELSKAREIQHMISLPKSKLGPESESRALYESSKVLTGSSYLYLKLLQIRFARIYQECAQEAHQEWPQKRMCLVLFLAASIETYQEVQPALLAEVSLRLSLLLALDGMIRVIRVEGLNSDSLSFFLNALEPLGLNSERKKVSDLIYSQGATKESVLLALIDMRRKLDQRIVQRQAELGYPRDLRLQPFNPLNVGL